MVQKRDIGNFKKSKSCLYSFDGKLAKSRQFLSMSLHYLVNIHRSRVGDSQSTMIFRVIL